MGRSSVGVESSTMFIERATDSGRRDIDGSEKSIIGQKTILPAGCSRLERDGKVHVRWQSARRELENMCVQNADVLVKTANITWILIISILSVVNRPCRRNGSLWK